jgi:hypothetical protein
MTIWAAAWPRKDAKATALNMVKAVDMVLTDGSKCEGRGYMYNPKRSLEPARDDVSTGRKSEVVFEKLLMSSKACIFLRS